MNTGARQKRARPDYYVPRRIRSAEWALSEVAPFLASKPEAQRPLYTPAHTRISESDPYHDLWYKCKRRDQVHGSVDRPRSTLGGFYIFDSPLKSMSKLLPLNTAVMMSPNARTSCHGAEPRVRSTLPAPRQRGTTKLRPVERVIAPCSSRGRAPEFAVCGQRHPEMADLKHHQQRSAQGPSDDDFLRSASLGSRSLGGPKLPTADAVITSPITGTRTARRRRASVARVVLEANDSCHPVMSVP